MAKASSTALANKLEVRAASKSTGMTVYDLLEKQKNEIAKVLPVGATPERLVRVVATEMRRNPKIAEASAQSILGCLMLSAQLGLEPGPVLKECYYVPFYNKNTQCFELEFIPGYMGLEKLALQSNLVSYIKPYPVYQNDLFEFDFGGDKVKHTRKLGQDRGPLKGFWAKAVFRDGHQVIEVMDLEQVNAHRERSRAKDSGPWQTDYEAMGLKTILKVLCNQLPKSIRMASALAADEGVPTFTGQDLALDTGVIIDIPADEEEAEAQVEVQPDNE